MIPTHEVRFGGWTYRPQLGELARDGKKVRLQVQPMQVFEELIARPGEMVTREHLIHRLWPDTVVEFDTALNSVIRRLRTALDDHAETPQYIETIPRRGYRFIGRIEPQTGESRWELRLPRGRRTVPATGWRRAAWLALPVTALAAGFVWLLPRQNLPANPPVPEAVQYLHRAQHLYQRRAEGDLRLAEQNVHKALKLDPRLDEGWAELAGIYMALTFEGELRPEQGLSMMRNAAERALSLNPRNAAAHVRLSSYRMNTGDAEAGRRHSEMALKLGPMDSLVLGHAGSLAAQRGNIQEAIRYQRLAVERDPLSVVKRLNLGRFLFLAGRLGEAEEEMQAVLELEPASERALRIRAEVKLAAGQYDESLEMAQRLNNQVVRGRLQAMSYEGLGRHEQASAALASLSQSEREASPVNTAEVMAFMGRTDEAFEWLHAALKDSSLVVWGRRDYMPLWTARYSPFLRSLHADPRWQAWMASIDGPRRLPVAD